MQRIVLFILLLILTPSAFAKVFSNMVNHPNKPGLAYSFSQGTFSSLQADENGWQTLNRLFIDRQRHNNQIALYEDGRGAIVATALYVYFVPFDDQGVSTGEFQVLLEVPDEFSNYSLKLLPNQNLVLVLSDSYMVQYQIVDQQAVEARRYSREDFDLPYSHDTYVHPDGTLLDFDGRVFTWDGSVYSAPFTVTKLAELWESDVLVLDANQGLIALQNYTGNMVRFDWPLTANATPETLATGHGWNSFVGFGSHSEWTYVEQNAFSTWLFDPTDPMANQNSAFDYPDWLSSYQDVTSHNVFEYRPVLVNDTLWFGPLKIEKDGENYSFDHFNPSLLSNFDLLAGSHGSPAWVNDYQQVSSETSLGLSLYSFDEQGEITSKTILEAQSQGQWAQLIMAEPMADKVFALAVNPNDTFIYAQIYQGEQLISEAPAFQLGHFDGRPIYGADSRPVISPDQTHVYFEVHQKLFHCDIQQLSTVSNCQQIDVERLIFPMISPYQDGIVYWGTHRHKFIAISHSNDQLLIEDKWDGKFEDECCIGPVFYNPVTDRLFAGRWELLADGNVVELAEPAKQPHFYNQTTGLAFGPGQSSGNAFGYDATTDSYYPVEFLDYLYPDAGEYFFRAYLGEDLLVFDNFNLEDGIKVIKAPFLVNLKADFNAPDSIHSYEELILSLTDLFTSEPESHDTWMQAMGYSSAEHKNAVSENNQIRFEIDKGYAIDHHESYPFKVVTEQGPWRVTFPLKTQLLNVNEAPVFSTVEDQRMEAGAEYGGELWDIVSDADGDSLTFTAKGLPPGLVLNGSYISGAPTTVGDYLVTVSATDPAGLSAQVQFTIKVETATSGNAGGSGGGGSLSVLTLLMLIGAGLRRKRYVN